MEENKLQGKKKVSAHSFLHFYRNHIMNVLVVLLIAIYFVLRMAYIIPQELQRCYNLLAENVEEAQKYSQYSNDANELYLTIQDQDYLSACNVFIYYIQSGYGEETCIDWLNSISDDFDSVFYLKENGSLISYPDRAPLSLTAEEKAQLLSEGTLQHEGDAVRYFALQNGKAYMIVRIDESCAYQLKIDALQMMSLDGFIYNNETLDVVEADENVIPDNVGSMYFGEPKEIAQFSDSQTQIRFISPYSSGLSKFINLKLAAIQPLSYQDDGNSICAYIPLSEIVSNILVKSGLPTFLCLGFICLSIFGALHFRHVVLKIKGKEDETKERKTIRLPFHCYIDLELTRCILFMQFFMGLLVIFCSSVLLTISRFSVGYEDAKYDLQQLVSTGETCELALDDCWDAYSAPAVGMAEAVNVYLEKGNVTTDENVQEDLQRLVESTFLEEISVYDRDGENVYNTADTVGYPLSTDPSSAQYSFWDLMSGDRQYIVTRSDSLDGIIYCAMKRSDAVGIVLLSFSDEGFSDLEQKLSPESITGNFYYADSCLFVDKNADETEAVTTNSGYRISSDGSRVSCETPNLPVLSNKETFCGFRTVDNQQCFVVGLGDESRSIFYLTPVSEIIDGLGESIATYIVFLLVICFLNFLGCAVYTEETLAEDLEQSEPKKHPSHHLIDRMKRRVTLTEQMGDSQKTLWKQGLYSTILLIVVTLLFDLLLNENSMLSFLTKGHWERGINLFALSSITLIILTACLGFRFLSFFFEELIKNFPAHFATAIQMVHSILNIVIVVFLAVCCANEVGIDTATILASVGISGLALGIAAKDTINDMLNGLFIIMDGRIQVGDFVEVGGFYGEVVKIGIRTTKVQRYNVEKSINNSDMKNLLNDSKGQSGVYLQFKVGRDTDLAYLKQLIVDAKPRFQEACRGRLTSDVYFLGVNDFDAYTITSSLFICCEERYKKSFIKKCRGVLLQLFEENGITIGSNLLLEAEDGSKVRIFGKTPAAESAPQAAAAGENPAAQQAANEETALDSAVKDENVSQSSSGEETVK